MNEPARKRKDAPLPPNPPKPAKKVKRVGPREDSANANPNATADIDRDADNKPKRTRTGCLTCRERHLKCDEGLPFCNNCKKSNRTCKRGVRLNFIDTWVGKLPHLVSRYGTSEWQVEFLDESRDIASEYQGGEERYPDSDDQSGGTQSLLPAISAESGNYEYATAPPSAANMAQQSLPPTHTNMSETHLVARQSIDMPQAFDPHLTRHDPSPPQQQQQQQQQRAPRSGSTTHSGSNHGMATPGSVGSFSHARIDLLHNQEVERKEFLDSAEETLFMQVFVEEVGLWMDSMDPHKHFSRLLPFHSLSEPMLLNAFLACGARHLTLVNPAYTEEKALHYYDTATRYLLKNLQNPERDTVVCATTAVILNVYEIMSERAMQRMNHIAGARALIKECGWDARARGIGAACFWLNVGLEVLSCLHFNWQVAWDPDDWGVDMNFSHEVHNGREEIWTHRMLYLVAKVCNFRATIPRREEPDSREQQIRTQERFDEWTRLREMIDAWNDGIPRTMHPMAYLHPHQTATKSAFPEIWLVKRSTIVARLFYHTAMLLLAQTNPYYPPDHYEMAELKKRHAIMVCGIAAHVKDRGVASVAIRSLAHAAEVLTDRREQEEVLRVFEKINKDTGWRIGFVYKELKEKWGWNEDLSAHQFAQTHAAAQQHKDAQLQAQAAQSMHMQRHHHTQSFDLGSHHIQQQHQQQQQSTLPDQRSLSLSSGIPPPPPVQQQHQQQQQQPPHHLPSSQHRPSTSHSPAHVAPSGSNGPATNGNTARPAASRNFPQGIPNPLYAKADFSLPQHPYQNFYVAPNSTSGTATGIPAMHHQQHQTHGESHMVNGDVGAWHGFAN